KRSAPLGVPWPLVVTPLKVSPVPEPARGESRAFDEGRHLRPAQLRVNPTAEAAVGAGDDVLPAHPVSEANDALGDQLGVLDQVGGMGDDARDKDLALW